MCVASEPYCGVTPVNNVVVQLRRCSLAIRHAKQREDFRLLARKEKSHPHFYNGQVHVMTSWEIRGAENR